MNAALLDPRTEPNLTPAQPAGTERLLAATAPDLRTHLRCSARFHGRVGRSA